MSTATTLFNRYNSLGTVQRGRRLRRAYVGLHGLAFERAQLRFAQAKDLLPKGSAARVSELEVELESLTAKFDKLSKTAKPKSTAPQASVASKYDGYIADIQRYDVDADATVVKKIVDYCGIALRSRDGQLVACSDETERNTVRDSFLIKKLGLKDELAELDALVLAVCETMSKDRMKNRVTFYYLLARNEGQLQNL